MKIIIDISRAINEKAGVGRYTFQLVQHLTEIDRQNQYLLLTVFMRKNVQKNQILKSLVKKNVQVKVLRLPGKIKEMLWQSKLPLAKWLIGQGDIFLAPTFLDVVENLDISQVLIVHDLTNFIFPLHAGQKQSQYYQHLSKIASEKASKIVAISNATKKDLIEILKINPQKIKVIYPGVTKFKKIAKNLPQNLLARSYILTVGTVEPRKNLVGLFKAYALLPPPLQEKYRLVVVGAKGWQTEAIAEALKMLKLQTKITFLGFVRDEILAKLYQEAAVFVYPSLYEGFGIPVLEALSFGLPVITSNISSLPEVAGKSALLVNPHNPAEISAAIQKLLEHGTEINKLKEESTRQAKKFSWENSAGKFLHLFEFLKK